ncbi:hypothetical protein OBBRIDRAFT_804067 [Obba rivulosa]|uniref:Uncharacterized protein n=1 Tax=Obba rivulosa TaxID=1052685 RepID=A0A8E2DKE0_9APHY|nr:hypothetical protein OBBRIDRAFT_804067 [Obba rivulosa]
MSFLDSRPAYFRVLGIEIIDRPDYDLMVNASSCNRIPAAQVKNWVPVPWRCLSVPPSLDAVDIPTVQDLVEFVQVLDAIYLVDPSICPPTRREIRNGMLVAGVIFLSNHMSEPQAVELVGQRHAAICSFFAVVAESEWITGSPIIKF